MFYIGSFLIILTLIFTVGLKTDFLGGENGLANMPANLLQKFKNKTIEVAFPKSEKEILIENLSGEYDLLDRFFSQTGANILNSQNIPAGDKKALEEAIQVFTESKNKVEEIKQLEKEDKSILKTIVEKIIKIEVPDSNPNPSPSVPTPSQSTIPASIPPNCKMLCE